MKNRCIYSYEFEDNCAYVGLTYNIENRRYRHEKNGEKTSSVYKHISICNNFKFYQLTGFMSPSEAKTQENFYVEKYKNEGWTILNETGTGSLGSNFVIWTYDKCKEEALKYNTRCEFQKSRPGCYKRCRIEGWLDELTEHMVNGKLFWTGEKILEDASKYDTYYNYRKNSTSYGAAVRDGWLEEICNIFHIEKTKPKKYWTKEKCQEEALKYDYRSDFQKNSKSAYGISIRNGWLNDICHHMIEINKPHDYWTKEKCQEEALKYKYMKDFQNYSKGAYFKCFIMNWLEDISKHMNYKKRKSTNYWTYDNCKEEALKYEKRHQFAKNSNGAYKRAIKNGWLDDICSHMANKKSSKRVGIF